MKKTSTAALAVMLLALPAAAQELDLKAKYDKKLASEFIKKATWERKLSEAQAKAATANKLIFGYFTRSFQP